MPDKEENKPSIEDVLKQIDDLKKKQSDIENENKALKKTIEDKDVEIAQIKLASTNKQVEKVEKDNILDVEFNFDTKLGRKEIEK